MDKIKNIEYNNEYIQLEASNGYIYKIPNNNSYIRNLLNNGIRENKSLEKDIEYFDKCANICMFPIWIAAVILAYGLISKFILLDLVLIVSGAQVGLSLIGTTIFKIAIKKTKNDANNNEFFTKIYEYAKNGGKINNNKSEIKKHEYTKQKTNNKIITPTKKTNISQSYYHLNKNQIIQDEEVCRKKR